MAIGAKRRQDGIDSTVPVLLRAYRQQGWREQRINGQSKDAFVMAILSRRALPGSPHGISKQSFRDALVIRPLCGEESRETLGSSLENGYYDQGALRPLIQNFADFAQESKY